MKLIDLYQEKIGGVIKGFDRIRFRGTLRWLANEKGMRTFLASKGILLKDFTNWAEGFTKSIRQGCNAQAERLGIAIRYLRTGKIDKEAFVRNIAKEDGITCGPICLLSVVEQCIAPIIKGNKASKTIELYMVPRKCVWLYYYFNHPEYGFGHVRLQSWFPFNIFICLNGRHWLERQLIKKQIGYVKDGNCFPWIGDIKTAQQLMTNQLQTPWAEMLNGLVSEMNPNLYSILPLSPDYYWSVNESEWATDIMFNSEKELKKLYPSLIYYAMSISDSPSVMRYMGKRNISPSDKIVGQPPKEIMTDVRSRYEGVRIKHWLNHNSIKMYNKSGSILRIETTINNTRDFKVFRYPNDDTSRQASWHKMRKGVSDLYRRSEVSNKCNERYGDALAACQIEEKLQEIASPACNKVRKKGKCYRGLNPWQTEDFKLLKFLSKGELTICGFRNKNLRNWLYKKELQNPTKQTLKKLSCRTSRRIKLLRAHGLVRKVSKENRYVLTAKGRKLSTAFLSASTVDIKTLTSMAA